MTVVSPWGEETEEIVSEDKPVLRVVEETEVVKDDRPCFKATLKGDWNAPWITHDSTSEFDVEEFKAFVDNMVRANMYLSQQWDIMRKNMPKAPAQPPQNSGNGNGQYRQKPDKVYHPTLTCDHGARVWVTRSDNGDVWSAAYCSEPQNSPNRCKPIYLDPQTGEPKPPKKRQW